MCYIVNGRWDKLTINKQEKKTIPITVPLKRLEDTDMIAKESEKSRSALINEWMKEGIERYKETKNK
jgi:metal-responsive CopG/Arc/MetJ family transcriptional regulator